MRRKTFDALLATGGVVVAAMLLVAGGLLVWAHSFINDQVETQLSAQQIYFPEQGSDSLNDPAVKPWLEQYAGQQLTNCLLYTSPSPRDQRGSRMPSSA